MIDLDDIKDALSVSARQKRNASVLINGRPSAKGRSTDVHDGKTCRSCGGRRVGCVDSRVGKLGETNVTRRRYACEACDQRFTTYEMRDDELLAMAGATDTSDKSAETRLLATMIRHMGITTEQIITAMAGAGK